MLGTYSIDENGDTTLTDYGVYGVKDGELDVRPDDQGAGRQLAKVAPKGVTLGRGRIAPPPAGRFLEPGHDTVMEAASIPAGRAASQRIRSRHLAPTG